MVIGYQIYRSLPLKLQKKLISFWELIKQPRMKKHYQNFIQPGDLVYDVGANVGKLTDLFLDLGAKVICVEPQPSCVKLLKNKFSKSDRITIVKKGLGETENVLDFFVSNNSTTNSTFARNWMFHPRLKKINWRKKIQLPITTLDELINKYGLPKFCKIDVEGFEEKVLKGLSVPIPYLSFEFDQYYFSEINKCISHLKEIGKPKFNYSLYFNYHLESDSWLTYKELINKLKAKINGCLRGDIYVKFLNDV